MNLPEIGLSKGGFWGGSSGRPPRPLQGARDRVGRLVKEGVGRVGREGRSDPQAQDGRTGALLSTRQATTSRRPVGAIALPMQARIAAQRVHWG